jgi:cytochrome b561
MHAMAAITYNKAHRAIHWATFGLMLAVFPVGMMIQYVKWDPLKMAMYDWHKWFGILILFVTAGRLAFKLVKPVSQATDINRFEQLASQAVHIALYVLLFAVPLVGWASSSALGFPVKWFWVVPLPDFVPVDEKLGFFLLAVHRWLAWTMGALLVAHAAAAIFHEVFKKDSVLSRMMPSRARQQTGA